MRAILLAGGTPPGCKYHATIKKSPFVGGFFYDANIFCIQEMIASTPLVCTARRSSGLLIKPSSMRSPNILISRMAPRRPQRSSVSDFTPRPLRPVTLVYSIWYWVASPAAHVFPPTKNVVTPVAAGVVELDEYERMPPACLTVVIVTPEPHCTLLSEF